MKLEVGKSYVNRNGETKTIQDARGSTEFPYWDGDRCYNSQGSWTDFDDWRDLIAEAPEVKDTPEDAEQQIDDGGPAFSTPVAQGFGDGRLAIGGLTVREWYAGMALIGAIAERTQRTPGISRVDELAEFAFMQADAMIKASKS